MRPMFKCGSSITNANLRSITSRQTVSIYQTCWYHSVRVVGNDFQGVMMLYDNWKQFSLSDLSKMAWAPILGYDYVITQIVLSLRNFDDGIIACLATIPRNLIELGPEEMTSDVIADTHRLYLSFDFPVVDVCSRSSSKFCSFLASQPTGLAVFSSYSAKSDSDRPMVLLGWWRPENHQGWLSSSFLGGIAVPTPLRVQTVAKWHFEEFSWFSTINY